MAESGKILHTDIAEEGALRDHLQKEVEDFLLILPAFEAGIQKTAKSIKESFGTFKIENLDDVKKLNAAIKETSALEEVHSKVQKTKIELTNKQLAQSQVDKQNKRDEITLLKDQIINIDKSVVSIKQLNAENAKLRVQVRNANLATKEGIENVAKWNAQINNNTTVIKANSDKLIQAKMNVGNYTESIKKAFEGTGALADVMNKYLGIITVLSDKVESIVGWIIKENTAKETSTVVTEANTVAEEANVAATEAAVVAEKANVVAIETQTAVTETATVAANTLGKSMLALATNPYVIAVVAIAALTKLILDNVNATQKQKDEFDATKEALLATTNTTVLASVGYGKLYDETRRLFLAEKELEDLRADKLLSTEVLRADAELAREAAAQEGVTTAQRIKYLDEYIDKTKRSNDEDSAILKKNLEIKQAYVDLYGKFATRKQKEELEKAKADVEADRADDAAATLKATKLRTNLIEKYHDEVRKLNQEAQKNELEAIDTFSEDKTEHVKKQYSKNLKQTRLQNQQDIDDLLKHQKELGDIDPNGTSRVAEFQREVEALKKLGASKEKDLLRKKNDDLLKIEEEAEKKRIELIKKQSDENAKQAEKDFKIANAKNDELESAELLAIEESYAKKKDFSIKAEEERQKAIFAVKLKYLELEKIRVEDNPEEQSKIQIKINDLKAAFLKTGLDLDKKSDDEKKKRAEERKKELLKIEQDITDGIAEGLQKRSELQQQGFQREIDFRNRSIEVQTALAEAGQDNILAEEQARATKAEEKKLQEEKKAAKQQENLALLKVFTETLTNALDSGEPFFKALAKAAGAQGITKTIFAKLFAGSFEKGTEDTGTLNGSGVDGKGGRIAIIHDNERILDKPNNDKLGGMTNDELVANAMFAEIYKPAFKAANVARGTLEKETHDSVMTAILSKKLDALQKSIENLPVQKVEVKGLMEVIETVRKGSMTTKRHYATRRNIRLHG